MHRTPYREGGARIVTPGARREPLGRHVARRRDLPAELAVESVVQAGDRLAVVDLLGIPQDVTAPIDGTLVEVFAQAGEAVEYGEEVAVVEAASASAPETDGTGAADQDGVA